MAVPIYTEKPVNFGDSTPPTHDYGYDYTPNDTATSTYSYPHTRNSGISVYNRHEDDPFGQEQPVQEETQAQALASNFRRVSSGSNALEYHDPSDNRLSRHDTASIGPLTYFDEDFNHYSNRPRPDSSGSLVKNAGDIERGSREVQNFDYADPSGAKNGKKTSPFARFLGDGARFPVEQRIENKKRGIGRQTYPFVAWTLTAAMVGVLIYELVYNSRQQGSPLSFKPFVNPMLGPSTTGLITLGARWPPCMTIVKDIPLTLSLGCPNNTANPPTSLCSVEDLCAFGGFHDKTPNQWWRFITPIFLHAGIIHLLFNMFAQLTLSAQVEREMGSGAFLLLYFAAGIFGNVFGGNFALVGSPSVGASGAIFGTVAVMWIDLFAHWELEYQPVRKLIGLIVELIIGIALGYVPGVDNFAHLGGFIMGLLTAAILYPVISLTKRHKLIMWSVRIAAIPLAVVLFVVLIRNFYTSDPFAACSWCRYLSCIPTSSNNRCKGNGLTTTSSNF